MNPHPSMSIAMVTAGLLALNACADGTTSGGSPEATSPAVAPPSGGTAAVPVTLADFMITMPPTISSGAVVFDVHNRGPTPHQLTVETPSGSVVGATHVLTPNGQARLPVTLPAGTYTYLCALSGHASLGMTGTITVTGS